MSRWLTLAVLALVVVACRSSRGGGEFATRKSQGEVGIQLTPRAAAGGRLVLELRADTHSGDLATLDLGSLVTLESAGKTYRAVESSPLSGHHGTGSVTFELGVKPDRFTVVLGPIRGTAAQRFDWP